MSEEIHEFLQEYFRHLHTHDKAAIQEDWHPRGLLFIGNEARPITFLQGLPPFVGFEINQVEQINVSGMVATAVVAWHMKMPGSTGSHVSHFNLVKLDEDWHIVSQDDYGSQEGS